MFCVSSLISVNQCVAIHHDIVPLGVGGLFSEVHVNEK